jgi:hypothetical protein
MVQLHGHRDHAVAAGVTPHFDWLVSIAVETSCPCLGRKPSPRPILLPSLGRKPSPSHLPSSPSFLPAEDLAGGKRGRVPSEDHVWFEDWWMGTSWCDE